MEAQWATHDNAGEVGAEAAAAPALPLADPETRRHPLVPVDADLVAALPRRYPLTLEELLVGLAATRVLIVRLGGVPWLTLLAVLASVLINLLLVGAIVAFALYVPQVGTWWPSAGETHSTWARDADDGGAGNGGSIVVGLDGLAGNAQSDGTGGVRAFVPPPGAASTPTLPALPAPPGTLTPSEALALLSPAQGAAPSPLTTPTAWNSTPTRRSSQPPAAPVVANPVEANTSHVVGPAHAAAPTAAQNTSASEGAGGTRGTGAVDRGGLAAGTGIDGEEEIDIMKPNAGRGFGKGTGRGKGDGIDRGPSAANLATPAVLEFSHPVIPLAVQAKAYGKSLRIKVMVEPDGRVGKIEVVESSGVPEFDTLYLAEVRRAKFRPAFEAGRAVAKPYAMVFSLGGAS